MIDRRDLLQRAAAMLGVSLASGTTLGVLSGCVATPPPKPQAGKATSHPARFFTVHEQATVAAISEQIIPKTDTPGAIELGVPAFIDRMMADFYGERQRKLMRAGLIRVDKDAMAAHGKMFVDLTPAEQVELMKVYDREAFEQTRRDIAKPDADPHFFRSLKELTTVGFFTTEYAASKILRYSSVPGPYRGDVPFSEVGRTWAT